jgi:hypothetical protein
MPESKYGGTDLHQTNIDRQAQVDAYVNSRLPSGNVPGLEQVRIANRTLFAATLARGGPGPKIS